MELNKSNIETRKIIFKFYYMNFFIPNMVFDLKKTGDWQLCIFILFFGVTKIHHIHIYGLNIL